MLSANGVQPRLDYRNAARVLALEEFLMYIFSS